MSPGAFLLIVAATVLAILALLRWVRRLAVTQQPHRLRSRK